ncbi:MAG: hypothetical protein ACU0CF_04645 [Sagittula sp.]|uniref:hypothetical protein n=1 Tax=Sagittula sp. TaxID=2038081 RepID=UPI004058FCD4
MNWLEWHRERGKPIETVELEAGDYLVEALLSAGPTTRDAMGGEAPLPWSEVWAFASATRAVSEPWEMQALVAMSRAYIEGKAGGATPFAIAPIHQN